MSKASTIVSGLSGLLAVTDAGVSTFAPIEEALDPVGVEQKRHLVRRRDLAGHHEGELVEKVLRVLDDARHTLPDTPPARQRSPIRSLKSEATPWVTATWPGPAGKRPETRASMGCPKGPWGSWARRS